MVWFLGIVLFGRAWTKYSISGHDPNAVNGSLLWAIIALPTIILISEDSLNAVPPAYTKASLALGAPRWRTLIWVKIPAAVPRIMASFMLGMGRAIELGEVRYFTTHYYGLFAISPTICITTFLVNLGADLILRKYQQREQ